jgi:hypothetical protein
VPGIEVFKPGSRFTEVHLYSKELRFKEGGAFGVVADDVDTDNAFWFTWTKGVIMHSGDHTASRYIIKEVDGSRYLFVEWKSGDYSIRGQKPWYYVYTFEPQARDQALQTSGPDFRSGLGLAGCMRCRATRDRA